ncbi:MAG: hypothetical protein OEW67_07220 [Cyclobacteriaceae bacterium]|nr:hypothetical protein [Cyclobacteriaceae bacterium]
MKNYKLSKLMTLGIMSLTMFFTISCEQNEFNNVDKDVKLENGRVVFKDLKAFENTMNTLHTYELEQIATWEKNLGHLSYRNSEVFMTDEEVVHDNQFAAVLNENAEYQIGDVIHKITHEIEYMIPVDKEEALIMNDFDNPAIEKFKIINQQFEMKDEKGNSLGEVARGPWGWLTYTYTYESKKRMKLQGWNQTFINYANCGVRTVFERKNFLGLWYNADAVEIGFTNLPNITKSRWRYYVVGFGYSDWLEQDIPTTRRTNQKDHSYTVGYIASTGGWVDVDYMTAVHYLNDGSRSFNVGNTYQ